MHDVFDPVPVADDGVGLGNFAVDSCDAGFEGVSLQSYEPTPTFSILSEKRAQESHT